MFTSEGLAAARDVVLTDPNGGLAPTSPCNPLSAELDALGISIRATARSFPGCRLPLPNRVTSELPVTRE
jgi:hypothetical protein